VMVDGRVYAVRTSHIVTLISVASYGRKTWRFNSTDEAGVRVFQSDDSKFMLAKSKIIWMLLHFPVRYLTLECLFIPQLRSYFHPPNISALYDCTISKQCVVSCASTSQYSIYTELYQKPGNRCNTIYVQQGNKFEMVLYFSCRASVTSSVRTR
jgi:hypothetical protein